MRTIGNSDKKWAKQSYSCAWESAALEIENRSLSGIQIRCPICHRKGTLISKWVKSSSIKPLYIIHRNGNESIKSCLLSEQNIKSARARIKISANDIIKTLRIGRPFVLFSGGKDSLCTLDYMRRLSKRIGVQITALHANTTAGFPEVEDYVEYICKDLGIPLVTVKPDRNFFELAKNWGIPGVRSRWCCKALKISPIKKYLSSFSESIIIYDGIRAAESAIRATYVPVWFHPTFRSICVSPIFHWSDEKVEGYINKNMLPRNPSAELGTSAECWCGAYKCRSDFEKLLEIHPDIFDKLVEVEKAQKGKYTFIYEKGKRIPLNSIA